MQGKRAFLLKLFSVVVLSFVGMTSAYAQEGAFCATPEQVALVRGALANKAPAPLGMAAAALKMPEAMVASALPTTQAYGVKAVHFQAIWKSLETWSDATTFITKGPNLFEIHGSVGKGEPSKRSQFFNLYREGPGLAGHLRPDLYGSIYLLELSGKENTLRAVVFFDRSGESVFSVYVPGEGVPATPTAIEQFAATAKLIRSLPSVCPG
ncbi:MAG: ChuX/HutX family heme-like substrate-binding protein [Gammaproteobacteria bacterium]